MPPARCPRCDAPLFRWYQPALGDPEDAEPHAVCSAETCSYGY